MRVSDSDREQAAEVLREAAGHGRITVDELGERLELACAAGTRLRGQDLLRAGSA